MSKENYKKILLKVAKFGSTSVASRVSIDNIAQIISENKYIKFVVINAIGGVTNLLIQLCQLPLNVSKFSVLSNYTAALIAEAIKAK